MIFVTVGTHEQPFNRLVEYMDRWAREHDEPVIIQIGFSTYEPKYCVWSKMYSYDKIEQIVDEARIVITHGGPSSFIRPLVIGKIPIVVPRKAEFNEHVNNHQVDFSREMEERQGNIIVVEDIDKLGEVIDNYNEIIKNKKNSLINNNERFCKEFSQIVDSLVGE